MFTLTACFALAKSLMYRVQQLSYPLGRPVLVFSVGFVASVASAAIPTDPGVPNLLEREAARTWHNTFWDLPLSVPMGFTGNVETGDPGDLSAEYRNASLLRYNMFRRMVGTQPLTIDPSMNARAQLAALFVAANNKIQHGGWPSDSKFYSAEADEATTLCELGLGLNDPQGAWALLYDFGEANIGGVGHRAGILAAWLDLKVGLGNVPATNTTREGWALADNGTFDTHGFDPDDFVLWPAKGYVPHYLVAGQWNIDIPDKTTTVKWSFKAVQITVLKNGVAQPIAGGPRGASDGAVWSIDGTLEGATRYKWYPLSSGELFLGNPNEEKDVVYHVILEGIRKRVTPPDDPGAPDQGGGELYMGTGRYEYDVIGYNPDRPTTMRVRTAPQSQTVLAGTSAVLRVEAEGVSSCQWYKDWELIPGATDYWLELSAFKASDAGRYHALLQGTAGAILSGYAHLSYKAVEEGSGRLVNVSTRSYVGAGDGVLVGGFIVTGDQPKTVLIRGSGPALKGLITQTELPDPLLRLYNSRSEVIASNDDWSSDLAQTALLEAAGRQCSAFTFTRGSKDAALLMTLQPGLYTAQLSAQEGTPGVGLVEVYELGDTGLTRMINLSGRAYNGIPGEPAIAGFVVAGAQKRKVLIRASGPALQGMVTGELADPELILFNAARTQIASNDDWCSDAAQADRIEAAATQVQAFVWTRDSKDAALLIELEPGLYTVYGRGKNEATGVTLVEVYEVP